jgi:hypothetical protein
MELGGPEVGRGCGGRGIIHGFEPREARLPRVGLRLRAPGLPRRRGLRRLRSARSPATCARRSSSSGPTTCSRSTSPTTSARPPVLPQARRQRRRRRHGRQQGRRHRRGAAFAEEGRHSRAVRDSADEDIRRKSANYEIIGARQPSGGPCSRRSRHQRSRCAPSVADAARPGRPPRICFKPEETSVATSSSSRPSRTCAAARCREVLPRGDLRRCLR